MRKVLFIVSVIATGLGCTAIYGGIADSAGKGSRIVNADMIEQEEPAVGAEPDDLDSVPLARVDLPDGWTLENDSGDSFVMSNADGSRAVILLRQDGCAVHVTFRQDGMNCVVSFDHVFGAGDARSDGMYAAIEPQPDGTMEMRYLLVGWPEHVARDLRDAFIPGRRRAVCSR